MKAKLFVLALAVPFLAWLTWAALSLDGRPKAPPPSDGVAVLRAGLERNGIDTSGLYIAEWGSVAEAHRQCEAAGRDVCMRWRNFTITGDPRKIEAVYRSEASAFRGER